ncbi:DsrH/TusB family sulfur metabolism protein [Methanothrix sp.]|uniref:DsrH/TusB family sulfur metabolism protein n=1 Tax=Methanothrix sp. TaxID=90426 RepID=UPI002C07A4A1|nr:DsrH/TusB family sulfur metabolism protein [Methanothrix sp.]HOK58401.1 DsrH/TusB family sulfur metabolism protein [Methanothrix sp.]HOL43639.1 DsrH/TusB family sulfur metabolism protein [Methanothrix sp.]HPO88687.1 DsrH/TusB family sulfur metabolism protein [Methanothrix sp.]
MSSVFILTKPPGSPRAELCLRMLGGNFRLYLLGDGVYNILTGRLGGVAGDVFAFTQDLRERGVSPAGIKEIDDYSVMVDDIMSAESVFAF